MGDRGSLDTLVRVLSGVAAALLVVIVAGTVWAFAMGSAGKGGVGKGGAGRDKGTEAGRARSEAGDGRSLLSGDRKDPAPDAVAAADPAGDTAVFADLGLLRAPTADKKPVTIVVSPFFPYPADDVAFREELVSKKRAIKTAILDWFSAKDIAEIGSLGETGVKAALLERVNAMLSLGEVKALYFGEYLVIE